MLLKVKNIIRVDSRFEATKRGYSKMTLKTLTSPGGVQLEQSCVVNRFMCGVIYAMRVKIVLENLY